MGILDLGMSASFLPLPVAVLRRRSVNAKSAKDLHDTAYFAWEVSVRLAVAAAPPQDASVLARASLGLWVGALHRPDTRIEDPRLLAVWRLLTAEGSGSPARPSQASPRALLRALPAYRNRIVGHGSVRLSAFYAEAGAVLQRGLDAAWKAGLFLDPRDRICRLEAPSRSGTTGAVAVRSLMGASSELLHAEDARPPDGLRADRLYLTGPEGWRALYPWLLSLDADGRERVLCLDAVGRRDVRFLDYATGELARGAELEARYPSLVADLHAACGDPSAHHRAIQPEAAEDPNDFGGFRILGKLGEGGMGVVYLARQASLGRLAAVKTLPRALGRDEVALARFRREVDALSRCEHPNVVKILTSGTARGLHYYAMEYVEGADLSRVARSLAASNGDFDQAVSSASAEVRARHETVFSDTPKIPPAEVSLPRSGDRARRVVALMRDAARGLHHLHEQGIVHRDIKPANIAVTEHGQRAVIMDLGLVALSDASRSLTRTEGNVVGTMRYVAPERLRGRLDQTDRRTDVYSLGATLCELLTDRPFFDGDSAERLMHQILSERPALPSRSGSGTPRDVVTIVSKATEKDPELRYATARDLAEDLDAYLEARPIAARAPTPGYVVGLAIRRHLVLSIAVAAAILLAVVGVVLFIDREQRARETEQRLRLAAEDEFGRAEELASYMLGDLRERLVALGRLDLLEQVARRAKLHYERLPQERQTPHTLTMRGNALDHVGLVLDELGDIEAALEAFRGGLSLSERVYAELPDALWAGLNVVKSNQRIAMTVEAFGKHEDARRAYDQALELLGELELRHGQGADPGELGRLRASLYQGVGRVHHAEGDLAGAAQRFREALEISRGLREAHPEDDRNTSWVGTLATSLANMLDDQGKRTEALALMGEALDARQALATRNPRDYRAKRDLASAHTLLAQHLGERDADAAHEHAAAAIGLQEALVAHDPQNTEWTRLLADGYEVHGGLYHAEGKLEPALSAYERSLAIREPLVAAHPERLGWQRGLASLHHEIGRLHKEFGSRAKAIVSYRRSLQIIEPLAKAHPDMVDWQYGVYVNNSGIAELLLGEDDVEAAARHQQAALEMIRRLVKRAPSQKGWQMELAGTLATGARIWRRRGEDAKAVRTYEQAIDVLKALASPDAPIYWYRLLGYVHSSAGRALMDLGRREEAAVQFGAAVDVLQQLARSRPQFEDKVAEYQALLDEARGKAR